MSLHKLAPELLLGISDQLDWDDRKSLSLVNSVVRNHLVPHLFKYLKADCPLPQDHILQNVVRKYGSHVSRLRLYVTFFPNPPNSKFEGTKIDPKHEKEKWYWKNYPASVWARDEVDSLAIRNLIQFEGLPNCSTLSLHTNGDNDFDIDGGWDVNDLADLSIYFCTEPEDWGLVKQKEELYAWREAMGEMWHDIASLSRTKHLELLHFLPCKSSIWLESDWSDFLGRLKGLTLVAYGQNNGAGWSANTLDGFNDFFKELPSLVFEHAKNLEHLTLMAQRYGHLGHRSLRFTPATMPKLQTLRLNNVCITASLGKFLRGGTPKLTSIHIENCAASGREYSFHEPQEDLTWAELWKAARGSNPRLLEVVYRYPTLPPLTRTEVMRMREPGTTFADTDDETSARLRKMVDEDEDSKIWPYITIDSKYGDVLPCQKVNLESLEAGYDNWEYKQLMNEVRQRQGVIGSSSS
ncbi:hypothetical protein FSHL1_002871 [Fusarium sambucinum]